MYQVTPVFVTPQPQPKAVYIPHPYSATPRYVSMGAEQTVAEIEAETERIKSQTRTTWMLIGALIVGMFIYDASRKKRR